MRRQRRPGKKPNLIPRTSRKEAAALELIIFMKGLKSATLFLVGLALFALVTRDLGSLAQRLAELLHFDVHREFIERGVDRLSHLTLRQKAAGGAGAIVYACVLAIEAVGLARRRAWAAWLAVGVGSLLLPVEVYELFHKPGIRLLIAFIVNIAVVVYLTIEARRARRGPKKGPFRAAWFAAHKGAPLPHHGHAPG
jgi:uncharacterized membrane protein (DUF2068 family)